MTKFAERLKELRTQLGLSQEELAVKLGVSKGTIGNYEAKKREPKTLEDLENIADFFNVEIDYLLGRTNYKPEFSLEETWIIECYRHADQDTKIAIKTLLRKYDQKDIFSDRVS